MLGLDLSFGGGCRGLGHDAIFMIKSIIKSMLLLCTLSLLPAVGAEAAAKDQLPFKTPVDPRSLPDTALIETTKGFIEIEFYREHAPITIKNFEHLARKGFYNNLLFHRVVENFVVQGGDPAGTGKGGPGYTLPPEFSDIKHIRGTIGQARMASEVNPGRTSNGSQFYICMKRAPHLDGLYTVFARVINGIEVVDSLTEEDRIKAIHFPKR